MAISLRFIATSEGHVLGGCAAENRGADRRRAPIKQTQSG